MDELALHIMDIIQNSISAQSSDISVNIRLTDEGKILEISVEDDGIGMDEYTLKNADDPFHTTKNSRSIGLGLPLLKEAALMTGGAFDMRSKKGMGAVIRDRFINSSFDRQPLGNIGKIFYINMTERGEICYKLRLSGKGEFYFNSHDFSVFMETKGKNLEEAASEAENLINSKVKEIFRGMLPEMGDL